MSDTLVFSQWFDANTTNERKEVVTWRLGGRRPVTVQVYENVVVYEGLEYDMNDKYYRPMIDTLLFHPDVYAAAQWRLRDAGERIDRAETALREARRDLYLLTEELKRKKVEDEAE